MFDVSCSNLSNFKHNHPQVHVLQGLGIPLPVRVALMGHSVEQLDTFFQFNGSENYCFSVHIKSTNKAAYCM